MEFDYDALRMLEALVRSGSFEAAGKAMQVSQSAVSQRIKQLEERVGSILVIRGRPCLPTEEGLLLCQHFEHVVLLEHDLTNRLTHFGSAGEKSRPKVRIAVNSDSLATWFPAVVKRVTDELELLLEVIPDDQEHTEDRLKSGDALAVVTSRDDEISGTALTRLGTMNYLAVSSPSFFAEHFEGGGVSLESLATAPTILFDQKDTLPEQWMEMVFGSAGVLPAHMVPSYEGLLRCCLQGVGWIMMPELTVSPLIKRKELVALVPDASVSVPLHWQTRSQSSELLASLTDIVEEVASAAFSG